MLVFTVVVTASAGGDSMPTNDGLGTELCITPSTGQEYSISRNEDFLTSPIVNGGDGSPANPWIIEGLEYIYEGDDKRAFLRIENVTDSFIVRECSIDGGGKVRVGIHIINATSPFNISSNHVTNTTDCGVMVEQSQQFSIVQNTVTGQGRGAGAIMLYKSTSAFVGKNTCTMTSNKIEILHSTGITIEKNTCSGGNSGILVSNTTASTLSENHCFNNHHGIKVTDSLGISITNNTLFCNTYGMSVNNAVVEQAGNFIMNRPEIFFLVAIVIVAAISIVATLIFLRWDKKHDKQPIDMEALSLERVTTTRAPGEASNVLRKESTGDDKTRLDLRVAWMIFKANNKNISLNVLITILLYGAIRISLLFIENIIVNTDEFRFLQSARLHDVTLFLVDMLIITFFLSPQHVIAHQAMGTGEIVSNTRQVNKMFWKSGIGYLFITILSGTSLFIIGISHMTGSIPQAWLIPVPAIGYSLFFVMLVVFGGVFPIYADTGRFTRSVRLQLNLFKSVPGRFFRTWGCYYAIFVIPEVVMSMLLAAMVQVSPETPLFPLYSIVATASFAYLVVFILVGYPLMALIAARIYHSIKNVVAFGQEKEGPDVSQGNHDRTSPPSRDDANGP